MKWELPRDNLDIIANKKNSYKVKYIHEKLGYFSLHLVKPINYCKGNDVSPLKILDSLIENLKENKSIFPSFYSNIRLKLINMIIYLNKKFNGSLTTLYL